MFVLLALVFGVGFVAFGVGANIGGTGIADILSSGGGSDDRPSVGEAREKLEEKPNDPTALRQLATALQTEGRVDEAVDPLERYTTLKPRDVSAQRELAGLYLTRANAASRDLQSAQIESQLLNPGGDFLPSSSSPLGQALSTQPITQAVTAKANERVNQSYTRLIAAYEAAKSTYQQIVKLTPGDAAAQFDLATTAQNSGDSTTAIAAYKRFLKLAPDDPNAPFVQQQIKQLESATSASASASAG
jgi:cytochrome c-type biogenesis protein CcmH/NrfG